MDDHRKASEHELLQAWEAAYLGQYNDAAMGRMFRGVLHNLNGVIQTFTMQAELFAMMFERAEEYLGQIIAGSEGAVREQALGLQQLLSRRAPSIPQMEEKVATCRRLLTRVTGLSEQFSRELPHDYSLNSVVENEVEFLCADSFFKHKVARSVELAPGAPVLKERAVLLHQILYAVLVNAVEAVAGVAEPAIRIRTVDRGASWAVEVEDNGPGIGPGREEEIFAPGVSFKEGHAGVGLYLARKSLASMDGTIGVNREPGRTRFTLIIPA